MENKKYRTFEIVDGKIKFTDTSSKFMSLCMDTCFSGNGEGEYYEVEFLKLCNIIGYLFSLDYSRRKSILLYHERYYYNNLELELLNAVSKLLSLYQNTKDNYCVIRIDGRDKTNLRSKNFSDLILVIKERKPSFVHIHDMDYEFDFLEFITQMYQIEISLKDMQQEEHFACPIIISYQDDIKTLPEFKNLSTQRRFYTFKFSDYEPNYHINNTLFGDNYTPKDYIQDLKFCMDCLDFYKDFNSYF